MKTWTIFLLMALVPFSSANDPLVDLLNKRSNKKDAILQQYEVLTVAPPDTPAPPADNALPFRPLLPEVAPHNNNSTAILPANRISRISLLLPLKAGGFVAAAAANFHEGCINNLSGAVVPIQLDLYEIDGNEESIVSAYQQAVSNQSDFIIGPLRKQSIAMLVAAFPTATIPTLVTHPTSAVNYYSLTIEVGEEMAQLAQIIHQQNYRVLLVSDASDLSRHIKSSFEKSWNSTSLRPLTHFYIYDQEADWQRLFEAIKTVSNTATQEAPAPDYPLAIVAAGNSQFVEKLRYFIPERLPVFASSIYTSNSGNTFIDNLWVMEMPWFLSAQADPLYSTINSRPTIHQRFYALGADACRIAVESHQWREGWQFSGYSGFLTLSDNQFIRRGTVAQYQSGNLQPPTP